MSVIDEIAAERRRQIEVEGWTPEHDDEHPDGHMNSATWQAMIDAASPFQDTGK